MVLRLIEESWPLDVILYYATGMDFDSVKENVAKTKALAEKHDISFYELHPQYSFEYDMCERLVNKRDGSIQKGLKWCGYGGCRWGTAAKLKTISDWYRVYCKDAVPVEYVGYAADEQRRLFHAREDRQEYAKIFPLVEWGMSEKDCLKFCYERGWNWIEDGIDLYSILSRLSCFCCGYKNLSELRSYYNELPKYWERLKALQDKMPDFPFYHGRYTISQLEERFCAENCQIAVWNLPGFSF